MTRGVALALLALAGLGAAQGCGADDDDGHGDDHSQAGTGAAVSGGVGATGGAAGGMTTAGTTAAGSTAAGSTAAGSSGSAGSTAGSSGSAGSTMAGSGGMAGTAGMMMAGSGGMAGTMMAGSAGSGMMMAGPLKYTSMFTMGMTIPAKNKCPMPLGGGTGENKSPALSWSGGPADVKSWAVVLYDTRYMMLHWAMWDIPATVKELPEGLASGFMLTTPMGARQVSNMGADKHAYYGPCTNAGGFAGTYEFRLYALNKDKLDLMESSTGAQAQTAIEAAQIEKVVWSGMPM